ncbi:hypothetical protein CQA49_06770 [Helicobacter sp. MIT 00-7814]|uniref:phage antirepressor KilAC domain-containing protein n=1 Tax=unclassified Helicobacter TaxID=2593540 RepID=UPI000E1F059A|nr:MULTISPECIES: phage antirepressor KilAC domain-containing protein [unclassified Helicobacter]RDU53344.1 hypothetical protein CQA49_06770 [Helicobacter sp. MIT 00-7814]RDU54165.1 hypothetical protein CQA37_06010 [Helicobacter sp. MIT 99-10781]
MNKIKELESKNAKLKDLLEKNAQAISFFHDMVRKPKEAMEMQEVAKVLNIQGMDKARLYAFLRNEGILTIGNHPYQEYIDKGYFAVVVRNRPISYGIQTHAKTLVFPAGLAFIHSLLAQYLTHSPKTHKELLKKQQEKEVAGKRIVGKDISKYKIFLSLAQQRGVVFI